MSGYVVTVTPANGPMARDLAGAEIGNPLGEVSRQEVDTLEEARHAVAAHHPGLTGAVFVDICAAVTLRGGAVSLPDGSTITVKRKEDEV